ncbi:MAG: LCP family protein [Propionicimonas sp.]|uniref:LCP family protein n=1 Tax=Propionicimonas sp. TaxID=1955623 RepID=UPI002B1EBC4E|nr:LCP family protein [Propionicimonas sp.]MEA4943957.1 LCP family protein [Propionicimonas sp.]
MTSPGGPADQFWHGEGRAQPTPSRGRTVWLILLIGFLALLLGATSFLLGRAHTLLSGIQRDASLLPEREAGQSPPADGPGRPIDFVIMAAGSGEQDECPSDELLIAHLSAARDRLYLISVPPELYVDIPGHGEATVNAAMELGGPALSVQTLEGLLGFQVEHAALVDFDRFYALADTVDGVDIDNRVESGSAGFAFPKGELHLDGDALLAYVGQCDGLPDGSRDRAERQRTVLKAMATRLATPAVLTHPSTLATITSEVGRCLTVDAGLTDAALWQFASSLRLVDSDDIVTFQAPIAGSGSRKGAQVDLADDQAMAELGEALVGDAMDAYVRDHKLGDGG